MHAFWFKVDFIRISDTVFTNTQNVRDNDITCSTKNILLQTEVSPEKQIPYQVLGD